MIMDLYVAKRYGTHSDVCLMLGLADLAEFSLREIGQRREIQITDEGVRYRLQFKQPADLEKLANLNYFSLFPVVAGAKTDISQIPEDANVFNTVEHSESRKLYRDYLYQGGKKLELGDDAPDPPDARTQNGVILTSMRHDRNHDSLWEEAWKIQSDFGSLIASIFEAFSRSEPFNISEADVVAELFKQRTGKKLPAQASAVKIFVPTAVQGVNRVKTDNNKSSDSQKDSWLNLWLIAAGLFEFGLSERIKVAEGTYDWRVVVLEPKNISLDQYRTTLNELRRTNPPGGGHGVARFDAELVLKFSQGLLNHHPAQEQPEKTEGRRRFRGQSVKNFVTGFNGTHFGSKGQVYGVKEVFSLGLPAWIKPNTTQDILDYLQVLQEHLSIVQYLSVDEGNSELLAAYRDFITGNELDLFFRFQVSYADYIVRQLANPKAKSPRLFSQEGLSIMVQSAYGKPEEKWSVSEITENPGFLRIARAINSATVYAGKIQTKNGQIELDWQRNYGLSQRLTSQASSKRDFIIELTVFLNTYENENLRIAEQLQKEGKKLKRIWPTKEDLDQVIALIDDERFGSSLVANLLIAYGYSRWNKPLKDEPSDTPTDIDVEDLDSDNN